MKLRPQVSLVDLSMNHIAGVDSNNKHVADKEYCGDGLSALASALKTHKALRFIPETNQEEFHWRVQTLAVKRRS